MAPRTPPEDVGFIFVEKGFAYVTIVGLDVSDVLRRSMQCTWVLNWCFTLEIVLNILSEGHFHCPGRVCLLIKTNYQYGADFVSVSDVYAPGFQNLTLRLLLATIIILFH